MSHNQFRGGYANLSCFPTGVSVSFPQVLYTDMTIETYEKPN